MIPVLRPHTIQPHRIDSHRLLPMSKRKGTAIETPDGNRSKQASTTVDTPRLLNFEDDEAPRLPEIGSDPDGFKLSASEKKLIQAKLVNTRDPNTM